MNWQDTVGLIGNVLFSVALLPAVFSRQKPHKATCFMTATVLYVYVASLVSLSQFVWAGATAITALLWTALLIQGRKK